MAQQRRKRTLYRSLGAWILTGALAAGMLPVVSMPASAAMGQYEKADGIMWLQENSFLISEDTKTSAGLTPVDKTTFIEPNTIKMGGSVDGDTSAPTASRSDTVTITSKHAIDWSQSFELQIHFENDGLPDGMAISFHNDPNYNGSKCGNGDLGVYSFGDNKGVTNAAIFEVDTFNNHNYPGSGQGAASDTAFANEGDNACHLGFALTNENGELKSDTVQVSKANPKLARQGENIVTITWDVDAHQATLSFEDTSGEGINETLTITDFNPKTLWADKPVYMTISASIHQDNLHGNRWGSYSLRVDSFAYTGLEPEESAEYLVYRDGKMDSKPVKYDSNNTQTWPMPGDKVVAVHTMWNKNSSSKYISIPIRVPEARISDSNSGYSVVQKLTPTDLKGTIGSDNIFNDAMSDSALSTATFTFPATDNSAEEQKKTVEYTYTIPEGIKEKYVIEDKVTIGSPIMTQYTFYNTINLGGLPTVSAPSVQLEKGSYGGSFNLENDVTYANYGGNKDNTTLKITNAEGQEVSTIDTNNVGTYKITYTVTDSRFHDAVTSIERTITVTDSSSGGSTGGGVTTKYTLTYESNGGTTFAAERYASGTKVELTKTPHRDGYVFTGWYSDAELSQPVTSVTMRKNMTVYAGWEKTGTSDLLNTEEHMAYLSGYDTGLFGPDNNMTRAEVAQMFYRLLLEKNVPITVSFTDVDADAWYSHAVNTLASMGIVTGVGDNQFDPERSITRAEFTAIAMRFADLDVNGNNIFSDVSANDWYYNQVVGSVKYGWITGYSDGTFRPNNTITRAEVTTIVNRMLGRAADEQYVDSHVDQLCVFPDVLSGHWAYYEIMEATNPHNYTQASGVEDWTSLK